MTPDDRIIELLTDSLKTQEQMLARLERVEAAQRETNLILQEHSQAILRLADKIEGETIHRIVRLEDAVFHV